MGKYEIFTNPPIVEAILEIKVQLPEDVEIGCLERIYDEIKERFQEKRDQLFFENGVNTTRIKTGKRGFFFYSKKDGKVVQSRIDGFAFNKLKPYESWDPFYQEAKNLWDKYSKAVKPVNIVAASLRYINRIEAPLPLDDFSKYILTNPRIAPGLPQSVKNFLMRIEIPNSKIGASAILTQTMDKPTRNGKLPLILDIEVISENDYMNDIKKLWKDFDKLRQFKNEIFFNSVTDKAKELFR